MNKFRLSSQGTDGHTMVAATFRLREVMQNPRPALGGTATKIEAFEII